jgi:hypothetical protein
VQHVRIEDVPLAAWFDHCADTRTRIDQPLGYQHPRSFAQHGPTDGIFFTEQGFGGELVVRFEAA